MTETNPRDALIIGDTSDLSEPTRQYLDSLPLQGGPAQVLARYAMRSQEDWRAERKEAARVADARQRAEDMQDAMALRGEAIPTLADRFRMWAAMEELEAREDDRRRARRAEEQLAARNQRVAQLEAELAKERVAHARERVAHARSARLASDRLDGWKAARRSGQGYDDSYPPRNYTRSGGAIVRGPY